MNTQLEGLVERGNSNRGTAIAGNVSPRHTIRRWMWIATAAALIALVAGGAGAYIARPVSEVSRISEAAFEAPADDLFYLAPSEARNVSSQGYATVVEALSEKASAGNLFYLAPSKVRDESSQGYAAVVETLSKTTLADDLFYLAPSEVRDVNSQGYAVVFETLPQDVLGKDGTPQPVIQEASAGSLFYLPSSGARNGQAWEYDTLVEALTESGPSEPATKRALPDGLFYLPANTQDAHSQRYAAWTTILTGK